jgi:hypothetical protein
MARTNAIMFFSQEISFMNLFVTISTKEGIIRWTKPGRRIVANITESQIPNHGEP